MWRSFTDEEKAIVVRGNDIVNRKRSLDSTLDIRSLNKEEYAEFRLMAKVIGKKERELYGSLYIGTTE